MSKKILLSIVLLTAIVFSFNYVFAENNMAQDTTNMVQNAGNTIKDSVDKTGNTMQNAGNAVRDTGNEVMNAAENVVDGAAGAINTLTEDRNTDTTPDGNNNDNNNSNAGMTTDNATGYTATRTAGEGTLLGMNATTWTWIIMGLVAISIIALVWYYSMQTTDKHYED